MTSSTDSNGAMSALAGAKCSRPVPQPSQLRMTSASLTASTACKVARPGCPGPTPTSLTLLMPPCPSQPGTRGDRLELSADHVAGEHLERGGCVAVAQSFQLITRQARIVARLLERAPRAIAVPNSLDNGARRVLAPSAGVLKLDRRQPQ